MASSGTSASDALVSREVGQLLSGSAAYQHLDPATRQRLHADMTTIAQALAGGGAPLAGQLAPPDLRQRLAPSQNQPPSSAPGSDGAAPAAAGSGAAAPAPQGPTGRVGEIARATLNAIDFPQFVAGLIHGTFQAIVDSSIKQMEAYAELLKNVAGTLDQFMSDNISEGTAKDYLADKYDGFLTRDSSGGAPTLRVNPDRPPDGEMPSFFKELGFDAPADIDDEAIDKVVVPATRRSLAEQRQQTLSTMVLMGINRVVVDEGEITAKLMFHIDASEASQIRFDQTKTTAGNMAGRAGRSPFTANAIMVNTTSLNAQNDINVRADLTGQVKVKFRSETFPLERFADSYAIQLINQNAKVPPPTAAGTQRAGESAPAPTPAAPSPVLPPARPTQPVPAPPGPVSQSLGSDPWWRGSER